MDFGVSLMTQVLKSANSPHPCGVNLSPNLVIFEVFFAWRRLRGIRQEAVVVVVVVVLLLAGRRSATRLSGT